MQARSSELLLEYGPDSGTLHPLAAAETASPQSPADEARHLLEQDRPAEAVQLALKHGFKDLAAELLARGSLMLVRVVADHDGFFAAARCLGADRIRRWPELEAGAIMVLAAGRQQRLASARLDELEARIPQLLVEGRSFVLDNPHTPFDRNDPETGMHCWVGMIRILIAAFSGEAEHALQLAARWFAAFPRATDCDVASVRCAMTLPNEMLGRYVQAEQDGMAALAVLRESGIQYGIAWCAMGTAYAQVCQGRVAEATRLLEEASDKVARGLSPTPEAQLPLGMLHRQAAFENGDMDVCKAALAAELWRPGAYSNPLFTLGHLRGGVRTLLVLGQLTEALSLFDRCHFEGSAAALDWWNRRFAIERARTAAIAGDTNLRWYVGPAPERDALELILAARRQPATSLLGPLRTRIQQAEEHRDSDDLALWLFLKARVEHDTGNALLARRSVQQLLTGALTRERVGTLLSLAPGLQPIFDEVLQGLVRDPSSVTEPLRRLAAVRGLSETAAPAVKPDIALSSREQQIAASLLEGCSNREIAERLHLTEKTIKWHLGNVFQKLGVRNRMGAARVLARRGPEVTG